MWGLNIRKLRHRSNPKVDSSSGFSKCHECGKLIAKSKLLDSKYCKDCYDTINLAKKLSLQRCASCHEYFDPSSSPDPHHCPKCLKKMRRCTNCHKKFIPNGKIILCPVCYSNIVKTCQVCKKDFIPKSRYHNLCPKCHAKIKHPKKSHLTKLNEEKNPNSNEKTVKLLIKALDDPKTQEYAINTLIELGIDSTDQIIQSLDCKDRSKRRILLKILCEMGTIVVDKLIEVLNDDCYQDDYFIRKRCVKALGLIGDERAVEPLIKTLDDYDSFVRSSSAKALGLIGDERAVEPLIESLENDINSIVRTASVKSLGTFGEIKAIDPIINALDEDEDPNLTIRCLKSLVEIDEDIGLIYLSKNVNNSKKQIADFSSELLISIKGEEFLKGIKSNGDTDVEPLSKEEFLQLVNNLLNDDPDIRLESVKLLGNSKNPRAAKYLVKLINDKNGETRLEVLKSLGKLKNLETIDSLIKTLTDDDTSVRWAAEEAIGNFGTEAIQKISESLQSDDDDLRYYLVAILGEIDDFNSETLLFKSLDDTDLDVRLKTIESLAKIGTDRSIYPLINLLNDDNVKIQRFCSSSLVKICQEPDLITLEYILKNDYQGENQALTAVIKKITAKIEKQQQNEKYEGTESKISTKKPDSTKIIEETNSEETSETNSSEDISENISEEDLRDDPFAILDAITKK